MRRLGAIAAILLLSGCSSEPAPVDPQLNAAARQQWFGCLEARAVSEDDGRSDAATIAVAVKGACRPEFSRLLTSQGLTDVQERVRLHNPILAATYDQKWEDMQTSFAVRAVLEARRHH